MTGQRWQRLPTSSLWVHDRLKMKKTGYIDLCESMTDQRWRRLATSISVRTWQAKGDNVWLQRFLWEYDRSKATKTGYNSAQQERKLCIDQTWWEQPNIIFGVHNVTVKCYSLSVIYVCSPVRSYWIYLSFSPGVSYLPLRTRDKKVYIRLSRNCVLWRTPFTAVHFLANYPSAIKTFETLVPAHQNIIYHIS